jgi:hypothetical protein
MQRFQWFSPTLSLIAIDAQEALSTLKLERIWRTIHRCALRALLMPMVSPHFSAEEVPGTSVI